jgi:hypothetical protein
MRLKSNGAGLEAVAAGISEYFGYRKLFNAISFLGKSATVRQAAERQ